MYNQSLGHAFDLLEILSLEPNGLKMTEIGRRINLNKSTTYRLLAEMKRRGYVHQDGERGTYRIGIKFIGFVSSYLNNVELKTEAHAMMCRLNETVDQTVYLAIQQEDEVVYIDKVEKYNSIRKYSIIGQRKPMHCTSLGKSLLLTTPDDDVRGILERQGMEIFSETTIATPNAYLEELQLSRERGWCLDDAEMEEGVKCVSAPIIDYQNNIIAALSISWYTDCCAHVTEDTLVPDLVAAASEISERMGCIKDTRVILSEFNSKHSKMDRPLAVSVR